MEKTLHFLIKIYVSLITVMLAISTLCFTTEFVCFNSSWFHYEYSLINDLSKWIDVDDAVEITYEMMQYCYGYKDSIDNTRAVICSDSHPEGREEVFFNQREKHHLADCRKLFTASHKMATVFLVISLISIAILVRLKKALATAKAFRNTNIAIFFLTLVFVIIFAANFDTAYDWIHELMFDNYLWILNPATDNLIKMMQTKVIIDTSILILSIWTALIVLGSILAHSYIRRSSTSS